VSVHVVTGVAYYADVIKSEIIFDLCWKQEFGTCSGDTVGDVCRECAWGITVSLHELGHSFSSL